MPKANSTAPTERMLAALESTRDSLLTLWLKLGDQYADWTERDIHVILHKARVTRVVHHSFDQYSYTEAQKAVGRLMLIHANYQKKWREKCQALHAKIEAEEAENERIQRECMTFAEVVEWMKRPLHYTYIPSYFDYVKTLRVGKDRVSYWQKREKVRPLYTWGAAERKHRDLGLADAGWTMQMAWQPVVTPGIQDTLWELVEALQHVHP